MAKLNTGHQRNVYDSRHVYKILHGTGYLDKRGAADRSDQQRATVGRTGKIAALLLVALVASAPRWAHAKGIAAPLRAAIFSRSLAYEKTFVKVKGSAVFAVVVPASGPGKKDATSMLAAFAKMKGVTVGGRKLRVVRVKHVDSASTLAKLGTAGAEVVYIPAGLESESQALSKGNRLLVCGASRGVGKGCHLSIETHKGRPRLVVDLGGTRRVGRSFDVRMLRLARVIR